MRNKLTIFTILGWLIILGYFAFIAAFICWVWCGWTTGWRVGVSSIIDITGVGCLNIYLTAISKKQKIYEREEG